VEILRYIFVEVRYNKAFYICSQQEKFDSSPEEIQEMSQPSQGIKPPLSRQKKKNDQCMFPSARGIKSYLNFASKYFVY